MKSACKKTVRRTVFPRHSSGRRPTSPVFRTDFQYFGTCYLRFSLWIKSVGTARTGTKSIPSASIVIGTFPSNSKPNTSKLTAPGTVRTFHTVQGRSAFDRHLSVIGFDVRASDIFYDRRAALLLHSVSVAKAASITPKTSCVPLIRRSAGSRICAAFRTKVFSRVFKKACDLTSTAFRNTYTKQHTNDR